MIAPLAALLLLTQSPAVSPEGGPAAPEAEIADVLDRLNAASAAADGDAYFALFAPDARFIGTDDGEHWSLRNSAPTPAPISPAAAAGPIPRWSGASRWPRSTVAASPGSTSG